MWLALAVLLLLIPCSTEEEEETFLPVSCLRSPGKQHPHGPRSCSASTSPDLQHSTWTCSGFLMELQALGEGSRRDGIPIGMMAGARP